MTTSIGAGAPDAHDRPRPDGSDIRKMTDADVAAVATCLAEAFHDDPHFRWIIRRDETRMPRLKRAFETFVTHIWFPEDESYVHDRLAGAALWIPPGAWRTSLLVQLRLAPAVLANLRADTGRLLRAFAFLERHHPHEPHWYLPVIGVIPGWQGRGYGSALLRPVLARCDADGVPAYLEASTPRNVALYERNGFRIVEECRYAKDGPPLWRMWREPTR